MPELPEVETIRRQLDPQVRSAEIVGGDAHWSDKFSPAMNAIGATIIGVNRRGKYLLFELATDESPNPDVASHELVAHLGMTGSFHIEPADAEHRDTQISRFGPHCRAVWAFEDGRQLRFNDTRRFGRLRVVRRGAYGDIPTLSQMGPEPFDPSFTGASLHAHVKKSSRAIKTQLLSQRPVAGVGNIYADEALFLAGIHPKSKRVGRERCDLLAQHIRDVLQAGIDNGGTTLRDYVDAEGDTGTNQLSLVAYGRSGEPCVRCGEEMVSTVIDARTTTYCPSCQRR